MSVSQNEDYEVEYWDVRRSMAYERARLMYMVLKIPVVVPIACDVGCGPYGGIFHHCIYPVMYAVDPLWSRYEEEGLVRAAEDIQKIQADAETFRLPVMANLIVSVNALDHSGDIRASFENIFNNLQSNGIFIFHVHMRTKKQLNQGHQMLITEKDIDKLVKKHNVVWKRVVPVCPFDKKGYRSYMCRVDKI